MSILGHPEIISFYPRGHFGVILGHSGENDQSLTIEVIEGHGRSWEVMEGLIFKL